MQRQRKQAQLDDAHALERLRGMIVQARIAMLTTLTEQHEMRSRPLYTERMDQDGTLWFIVGADAAKVSEARQHGGRVCVAYADVAQSNFASITGTAELVDDPALKAQLWSRTAETWFPCGKSDAAVALLKVTPEKGEWWDGPSGTAGQLYAFAKVALTGDTGGFGTQARFRTDQAH